MMSSFATRRVASADAVWKRQSSSTKAGASEGVVVRSCIWEGFWKRVSMPCVVGEEELGQIEDGGW